MIFFAQYIMAYFTTQIFPECPGSFSQNGQKKALWILETVSTILCLDIFGTLMTLGKLPSKNLYSWIINDGSWPHDICYEYSATRYWGLCSSIAWVPRIMFMNTLGTEDYVHEYPGYWGLCSCILPYCAFDGLMFSTVPRNTLKRTFRIWPTFDKNKSVETR